MIQSKKLFKLMTMLTAAAMITLAGCDDDSSTEPEAEDALVGTWNFATMMTYYGSSIANADSSEDVTAEADGPSVLTFNADGTGSDTSIDEDGSETSTWTYTATADSLSITGTEDDGTEVMVLGYEISGSTLTLTMHDEGEPENDWPESWTVLTFTKQ